MKNNSFNFSSLSILTLACFALAAFGCSKSDSLGLVGQHDSGTDGESGADADMVVDAVVVESQPSTSDVGAPSSTYLCQLNTDGTCSALTPNTNCLPYTGRLYDEKANCISETEITLYCSAWSMSTMGGFAGSVGCYQVGQDGGALIYSTPESDVSNPQWRSQSCDASLAALVKDAAPCSAASTDGGNG